MLYDEKTFYNVFLHDLEQCKKEVYIESPYLTSNRMKLFYPIFKKLLTRRAKIYIVTRLPEDHNQENLRCQAEIAITKFEQMGIQPLLCLGNHHRKLAILDRSILWEGSLNILYQAFSREVMRRMESNVLAIQMFDFLGLQKYI